MRDYGYRPRLDFGDIREIPVGEGTITVNIDVNLFGLSDEDTAYVFRLVDLIQEREKATAPDGAPILIAPEDEPRLIAAAKAAGFQPSRLSPDSRLPEETK